PVCEMFLRAPAAATPAYFALVQRPSSAPLLLGLPESFSRRRSRWWNRAFWHGGARWAARNAGRRLSAVDGEFRKRRRSRGARRGGRRGGLPPDNRGSTGESAAGVCGEKRPQLEEKGLCHGLPFHLPKSPDTAVGLATARMGGKDGQAALPLPTKLSRIPGLDLWPRWCDVTKTARRSGSRRGHVVVRCEPSMRITVHRVEAAGEKSRTRRSCRLARELDFGQVLPGNLVQERGIDSFCARADRFASGAF